MSLAMSMARWKVMWQPGYKGGQHDMSILNRRENLVIKNHLMTHTSTYEIFKSKAQTLGLL
jgi:hypothetical protein